MTFIINNAELSSNETGIFAFLRILSFIKEDEFCAEKIASHFAEEGFSVTS